MNNVNMNLAQLRTLIGQSEELNTTLASKLENMASTLNSICPKVNSTDLSTANKNLVEAINNVANSVKSLLPTVNQFLNNQVGLYTEINTTATTEIDSLVSSINSAFGAK